MHSNYITIGMINKKYQLFWVTIAKGFRFRSMKIGRNLLNFLAKLVKNDVNHRYVFYHTFHDDLTSELSEPILESRKIGLQCMLE